jgi:hypothetical protein
MLFGVKIVVATGTGGITNNENVRYVSSCGENAPFCVVLLLHCTFQGCNPSVKKVV